MKRYNILILLLALLSPLALTSCSEDENTVEEFPDWQNRNETSFNNIYEQARANTDGNWKLFLNYSLEDTIPTDTYDYIAVEVLTEGTGSGCPMYTDSVLVNYRGRLIPSTATFSTSRMKESTIQPRQCRHSYMLAVWSTASPRPFSTCT